MRWTEEEYAVFLRRHPDAHEWGTHRQHDGEQDEMPEARFMTNVIRLAKGQGYMIFHVHDSRRSPEGYPDLTLAQPGKPLLFVETKTNTGKLTREQVQWLAILERTEKPETHVWRPRDWPQILETLGVR